MELGNASFIDCEIDSNCRICNVPILHESVACPKCLKVFHSACVNPDSLAKNGGFLRCCGPGRKPAVNNGTFTFSLEDIQMVFRDEITPLKRRLDNVEIRLGNLDTCLQTFSTKGIEEHSAIIKLNQRLDSIVSSENGAPSTTNSLPGAACDLFKEFDDRMSRRSNVMLFGLSEDNTVNSEESNLNVKVTDYFAKILDKPGTKTKLKFKCMRVGKVSVSSTNPRPTKVIFNDPSTAENILQAYIRSKSSKSLPSSYPHLIVARDQTPMQRQEYKALKEELKMRTSQGEKNLKIVTKGNRQIITQRARISVLNRRIEQ